jgi:isopenicillin N synthase-like dioxygenase
MFHAATDIPVIDLRDEPDAVSLAIHAACRRHGFFYVVGHGIDESLGLAASRWDGASVHARPRETSVRRT